MSVLTEKGRRLYYRANPDKGWFDGFTTKTHYEMLGPEVYEVWMTYMPKVIKKKLKDLRKWFRVLDGVEDIPYEYRRRQTPEEFVEMALLVLARVDMIMSAGGTIRAGSQHICPIPWAIFGQIEGIPMAQNHFADMNDIWRHYQRLLRGSSYGQPIHLLHTGSVPKRLGAKHDMTANLVIAIAILLLTDIILNCGPDCVEFYDLFTNDYRHDANSAGATAVYGDARKRVYGKSKDEPIYASRKSSAYSIYSPQRKAYYNKSVKIVEAQVGDDLAAGERTTKTRPTLFLLPAPKTVGRSEPAAIVFEPDNDNPTLADLDSMWTDLSFRGVYCD